MRSEKAGCLIAFEGTEGSGKSTQVELAAVALRQRGREVLVTAEPGATVLGGELRRLLLHSPQPVPVPLAELFLYLADRAQHVAEVIQPAIEAGIVVLTDRFSASTIAYQGSGRGLELDQVVRCDAWARSGVAPRLTVLLDCPVRVGLARARGHDRFHAEEEAFHERVRSGFLRQAQADPARWHVVDATRPEQEVHRDVVEAVARGLTAP